jgi:hypothetical protein
MSGCELRHEEIESVSAAGSPCRLTFTHLPNVALLEGICVHEAEMQAGERMFQK